MYKQSHGYIDHLYIHDIYNLYTRVRVIFLRPSVFYILGLGADVVQMVRLNTILLAKTEIHDKPPRLH